MLRRFVALGLVGLFLVMSFVVAEDSIGPYNPIADINRDGVVGIMDLVEVGQAYGSNYTPITQPNKTIVTVLSLKSNLSYTPVADAIVAVFPPDVDSMVGEDGIWEYTDCSGTTDFDLAANTSYVAIAWDNARTLYNYVNFTTNSLGEAAVAIWLNYYPPLSAQPYPIRTIPKGWIVITVFDNNTCKPYTYAAEQGSFLVLYRRNFTADAREGPPSQGNLGESIIWDDGSFLSISYTGIFAIDSILHEHHAGAISPLRDVAVCIFDFSFSSQIEGANCTYRTDEYGGAHITATIYRYW